MHVARPIFLNEIIHFRFTRYIINEFLIYDKRKQKN